LFTFTRRFTAFVNTTLKILLTFVLAEILIRTFYTAVELGIKNIQATLIVSSILIVGTIAYGYLIYRVIKSDIAPSKIIILILFIALILRLSWILTIHTEPISDFQMIFESGGRFINGDYSMFKGEGYIARFTHLTMSVIYYGLFHKFFSNPLIAIKLSNVIWSTLSIYLIYLIVSELYDEKEKGIWGAFVSSIFPPFIMYTSVTCTENHAMPFLLGSIYIFLLVTKERKSPEWILLSGLLLFIGHVFRMVGSVIIVGYIMYVFLYFPFKKGIKLGGYLLSSLIIPLYLTSTILLSLGVTEYPLWKGREPSTTSILRGTNIKSNGTWNEEDAKLPEKYNYDYIAVKEASKAIIKERLATTPPFTLLKFYIMKFASEWSSGDFAALYWSTLEVTDMNIPLNLSKFTGFYSQLVYCILFGLAYIGLFNNKLKKDIGPVNLLYILFCGFGLLYLITENQSRYGYIVSWIFIVLVFTGVEKVRMSSVFSRFIAHRVKAEKEYNI
jgi:4-amino-4-deoxy-L-arabinose transferase-like glycosyltransferase